MTRFKFIVFLLLIVNFEKLNCLRSFDIRWCSVNCSIIAKSYFGFFNCSLHEWPRNRGNYVSADLQFSQELRSAIVDIAVSFPRHLKNILIKFRLDSCRMSKYQTVNPMVTAVLKQMYQSSNFPNTCPLKANVAYAVKGLSLNPDYFPGNTQEMKFAMNVSLFSNKVHVLAVQFEAKVEKKKNRKELQHN